LRILIVDDDKLVISSLKTILMSDNEIEVVGTGQGGKEAIHLYFSLKPDILLIDIRMDGMTGLEAAEIIINREKTAKILFLTTFSDNEYILKALQIGAKGYILKQNYEGLIPSIKAVFMGQRVFGDEIITRIPVLLNHKGENGLKQFDLSDKEIEIIRQVSEGLSNKEISEKLFLSEGTVRNYISVILEKLNLRDRTQLAIFYYKNT
jgi:DNA-binding NarL/FixJ family response regulator